ncbi:hypothetical protein F4778DRAFT_438796 [Xylariomycetidae sp. FL2044]|nr:hypothetical protein F4778DRAFT_438796 [Xylariomycetidae sp. FL2044]
MTPIKLCQEMPSHDPICPSPSAQSVSVRWHGTISRCHDVTVSQCHNACHYTTCSGIIVLALPAVLVYRRSLFLAYVARVVPQALINSTKYRFRDPSGTRSRGILADLGVWPAWGSQDLPASPPDLKKKSVIIHLVVDLQIVPIFFLGGWGGGLRGQEGCWDFLTLFLTLLFCEMNFIIIDPWSGRDIFLVPIRSLSVLRTKSCNAAMFQTAHQLVCSSRLTSQLRRFNGVSTRVSNQPRVFILNSPPIQADGDIPCCRAALCVLRNGGPYYGSCSRLIAIISEPVTVRSRHGLPFCARYQTLLSSGPPT